MRFAGHHCLTTENGYAAEAASLLRNTEQHNARLDDLEQGLFH